MHTSGAQLIFFPLGGISGPIKTVPCPIIILVLQMLTCSLETRLMAALSVW